MTTPALYRKAIEGFDQRVDAIDEKRLTNPVPCCPEEVANRVEEQLSGDDPRGLRRMVRDHGGRVAPSRCRRPAQHVPRQQTPIMYIM